MWICFLFVFFGLFPLQLFSSVLWYCWLGLLTCKNRLPYNLYCVGGDVKRCTIQFNPILSYWLIDWSGESEYSALPARHHIVTGDEFCWWICHLKHCASQDWVPRTWQHGLSYRRCIAAVGTRRHCLESNAFKGLCQQHSNSFIQSIDLFPQENVHYNKYWCYDHRNRYFNWKSNRIEIEFFVHPVKRFFHWSIGSLIDAVASTDRPRTRSAVAGN